MSYHIEFDCKNINWDGVCSVLSRAGLATHSIEQTKKAFGNSYVTVFVFENDLLIGTGRAISDGVYQSGIYDIAVLPEYQGKGIGKTIMKEIHNKLPDTNIILYARPSAQGFYKKLNYSRMLTGMAQFKNEESMRERGFIE